MILPVVFVSIIYDPLSDKISDSRMLFKLNRNVFVLPGYSLHCGIYILSTIKDTTDHVKQVVHKSADCVCGNSLLIAATSISIVFFLLLHNSSF